MHCLEGRECFKGRKMFHPRIFHIFICPPFLFLVRLTTFLCGTVPHDVFFRGKYFRVFTVLMTEFDYILLQDVLVRFSDWHFANGYSDLIQTLKCPLSYQMWMLTVEIFYGSTTVSEQSSVNVFVNQTRKSKHAFFLILGYLKENIFFSILRGYGMSFYSYILCFPSNIAAVL